MLMRVMVAELGFVCGFGPKARPVVTAVKRNTANSNATTRRPSVEQGCRQDNDTVGGGYKYGGGIRAKPAVRIILNDRQQDAKDDQQGQLREIGEYVSVYSSHCCCYRTAVRVVLGQRPDEKKKEPALHYGQKPGRLFEM